MSQQPALTFLVVDDDAIFHFLMMKLLERLGIPADSVRTALSGREALDLMVEAQLTGKAYPDFIMLDLNMPMMDGFAFLEACHKLPERLPQQVKIIIISSSLDKRDRDRALHLGASHYLIKPVTETDLEAILRSSESK